MERTPAGIRSIFFVSPQGDEQSAANYLAASWTASPAFCTASPVASSGVASGAGSGVASSSGGVRRGGGSGVNGGFAGSGGSVRRSSGGVGGGVSSLASGSSGVSSGFLRGFDGFFLLGAAGEGQRGEGGSESDLRVHGINTPVDFSLWM